MTDTQNILTDLPRVNFENNDVIKLVNNAFLGELSEIHLICNSLEANWSQFRSNFKIEKAAGGKVFNAKNEVLFIYRFNKWDLPKGKLKKGESIEKCALREVEEECGVTDLWIERELEITYHIFKRKDTIILKITHWFLMSTSFLGKLIPQLDEGIKEVVFKNEEETIEALKNTYRNIKLLF
ncbi:NUDIX hydrolase [Lutibacter sp.]|uniref:NUDIX hydrolase n=1 Tax=Lutibacter sp. TaxID=1925666 RepID=UPI002732556E|nr:NUDIX domain-containing protein [Lutibacter sp.]MDP3312172.1 NUDIX domain-containing protein [Lutibacter sp.]